jgi:hypothetical protein
VSLNIIAWATVIIMGGLTILSTIQPVSLGGSKWSGILENPSADPYVHFDKLRRKVLMQPIRSLAAGGLRAVRAAGYLEVEGAGIAVRTFCRAADGTLVATRSSGSAYEVKQHDAAEGGSLGPVHAPPS